VFDSGFERFGVVVDFLNMFYSTFDILPKFLGLLSVFVVFLVLAVAYEFLKKVGSL